MSILVPSTTTCSHTFLRQCTASWRLIQTGEFCQIWTGYVVPIKSTLITMGNISRMKKSDLPSRKSLSSGWTSCTYQIDDWYMQWFNYGKSFCSVLQLLVVCWLICWNGQIHWFWQLNFGESFYHVLIFWNNFFTQTCVIVYFAFILPMQSHSWTTHKLAKHESMGYVYNFLLEMLPDNYFWQFQLLWQRHCNEHIWNFYKRTTSISRSFVMHLRFWS